MDLLSLATTFFWVGVILAVKCILTLVYKRMTIPIGQPSFAKRHDGNPSKHHTNSFTTPINNQQYDAIIIGAGAAGLAVGYQLCHSNKNKRINCLIVDSSHRVGEVWDQRYDRLHLHTPKAMSELPGLSMPSYYPEFMSKGQFSQYLQSYAMIHNLPILHEHTVTSATFDTADKLWTVQIQKDEIITISSTALICCCGRDGVVPKTPTFENQKAFKGQILHSSEYQNASAYQDRNVLLVGCGNTAIDIALDCYEYGCAKIYQLVRSPIQIFRRDKTRINSILPSFFLNNAPKKLGDFAILKDMKDYFSDLEQYGIRLFDEPTPMTMILERLKPPVLDLGWTDLVRQKEVTILTQEIKAFYDDGVILKDGQRRVECDVVILATGWMLNVHLESCFGTRVIKEISDKYGMIKSGYEIQKNGLSQLYFCGFADANGRIYEIGLESKRIANDLFAKYV